jgi:cation diffusion facilitator CzcD-associated flavoprotein CzcO
MTSEHVDVLIVGAGLSGICAAYYLQTRCPAKRFAILEGRDALGGTWDLFRYPGIRSDSHMHTFGYAFRPWRETKAIADGPSILTYIRETAQEYGIDRKIRFGHQVRRAAWSSADATWTVEVDRGPDRVQLTCNFLYMCSGYYDYAAGYTPEWPAVEGFAGRVVHPQQWPRDLDYAGKRVVVIGSGATAVTLVPALAAQAAHVTMLQRSPTYIVAAPSEDALAAWLHRRLPDTLAYRIARWKSILLDMYFYNVTRRRPAYARQVILQMVQKELGPDYDVDTHFTPRYNPWYQRLCLVPDSVLFAAIRSGKASVVTDQIASFTETGIHLRSGQELSADIVVTATGLKLRLLGGVQLVVDGAAVELSQTMSYKGAMYSGVPNLASAFGYTNASWTLKCELTAQYVCRLLNYMDRHGYAQCTPRRQAAPLAERPVVDLTSGYVQRAIDTLPRQGTRRPWRMYQNYARDVLSVRLSRVNDGAIEFARRGEHKPHEAGGSRAWKPS